MVWSLTTPLVFLTPIEQNFYYVDDDVEDQPVEPFSVFNQSDHDVLSGKDTPRQACTITGIFCVTQIYYRWNVPEFWTLLHEFHSKPHKLFNEFGLGIIG